MIYVTIFLILGIPLLVLSVYFAHQKNVVEDLKFDLDLLKPFNGFQRIGKYGYFRKLEEKMSYNNGQKACSKLFGHIVEFDEREQHNSKFF